MQVAACRAAACAGAVWRSGVPARVKCKNGPAQEKHSARRAEHSRPKRSIASAYRSVDVRSQRKRQSGHRKAVLRKGAGLLRLLGRARPFADAFTIDALPVLVRCTVLLPKFSFLLRKPACSLSPVQAHLLPCFAEI